jgi:excisionase family DNA binding protein
VDAHESDEILGVDEVAALLRVGPEAIYRQLRTGKMPGRKLGREWRVSRQALLAWLSSPSDPELESNQHHGNGTGRAR